MNRKRNIWISILASLLSGALVYSLYQLQEQQIELQETLEVVIPNRFIAAGERIEEEDLTLTRMSADAVTVDMITTIQEIVGQEAAIPMGRGEPVLNWKLNALGLQPKLSESTFQIPKDYILSISNGIRAGDRVYLYASSLVGESKRLFHQGVIVASVKTSGNVEIDNMQQSHLASLAEGNLEARYAARRDANGTIANINLNLTEQQWLEIDRLCKNGEVKLVVAYSSESYASVQQETIGVGDRQ